MKRLSLDIYNTHKFLSIKLDFLLSIITQIFEIDVVNLDMETV